MVTTNDITKQLYYIQYIYNKMYCNWEQQTDMYCMYVLN